MFIQRYPYLPTYNEKILIWLGQNSRGFDDFHRIIFLQLVIMLD